MSRIAGCFDALSKTGRKALVPYIVAGDPSVEFTVPMMHKLVEQGADILEIGVPFSDPMAEGPVIQLAHERALEQGIGLRKVLAMVADFREKDSLTPIVLMGYANPVEHMGYAAFAKAAAEAGIDGLLTVDIPPEESHELNAELKKVAIDNIFLIAPTSTEQRIRNIAELASGYVYYVSLKGVTGAGHLDIDSVRDKLAQIKSISSLPVTVGFGIKDAESAAAVGRLCEGVVVGSALVNLAITLKDQDESQQSILEQSTMLISDMRKALDALN